MYALTVNEIIELAEYSAKAFGFESGQELEGIVKKLGGKIAYKYPHELDLKIYDFKFVNYNRNFMLYLSSLSSPLQRRLSIATFIGHFILHFEFGRCAHTIINEVMESRANIFAMAFLMPREETMLFHTDMDIASYFKVPLQCAILWNAFLYNNITNKAVS